MKKFKLIPIIVCVFALSACDKTHDIPYYKSHQEEMKKVLAKCKTQSPSNWNENCHNANDANAQIFNDNFFK